MTRGYACPKCQSTRYETGELRAAGGFLTKLFNIQTQRYTTVSCSRCHFTEIYKGDSSMLGNVLDFFTN